MPTSSDAVIADLNMDSCVQHDKSFPLVHLNEN